MNWKINFYGLLMIVLLFASCNKETVSQQSADWLIPADEILDGGPGKDGIPSVDNPNFASVAETSYLADSDLVVGFKNGDLVRAYPHQILDWHEIVNDEVGDIGVAITYCPLTGTAIGWDRMIGGEMTSFGVSGLLYNTNLLPYDRKTDSNWSQMRLDCVNGELEGQQIQTHQVIETTWATWKMMFPESEVMTTETGISRSYGTYPYLNAGGLDYRVDDWLLFNVTPFDDRLSNKERVLGVIDGSEAKTYRFSSFTEEAVNVIQDDFNGQNLVIVGSQSMNFLAAFQSSLADGTSLSFEPIQNGEAAIMLDNEGNKWNLFGEAIEGARLGQKLENAESYLGYWVGWGAFYPDAEIHE